MAKFISSLITEASGSVAGTTYSRNKNGSYIRNKSVPVNRNTLAQQAARALFSGVSSGWKALTAMQRSSWENQIMAYPYVDSLGQTKYYTASQLYKSLNGSLVQVGLNPITTIGAPVPMINLTSVEVETSAQTSASITINSIGFTDGTNTDVPAGFLLAIYATDIKSQGFTSPKNSDFRYIAQAAAGVDVTALALEAFYTTVFGNSWQANSSVGLQIFFGFKLIAVATGQRNNSYFMNQSLIQA
jgi:hypothetical protein